MKDYEVLHQINEHKVCAIVRGVPKTEIKPLAEALIEGGIKVIEVTFNTEGASEMIETLCEFYPDDFIVGAGTVLDEETARIAILSGAKFVLSPNLNVDVIKMCKRYNVLAVPGVATPTEAMHAWENGAHVVKVFPAGVLGADYIKQLKGPLNQIDMMAVGGVNISNINEFLSKGASSVGIGGDLVNAELVSQGNFEEIKNRAKAFVEAARGAIK